MRLVFLILALFVTAILLLFVGAAFGAWTMEVWMGRALVAVAAALGAYAVYGISFEQRFRSP